MLTESGDSDRELVDVGEGVPSLWSPAEISTDSELLFSGIENLEAPKEKLDDDEWPNPEPSDELSEPKVKAGREFAVMGRKKDEPELKADGELVDPKLDVGEDLAAPKLLELKVPKVEDPKADGPKAEAVTGGSGGWKGGKCSGPKLNARPVVADDRWLASRRCPKKAPPGMFSSGASSSSSELSSLSTLDSNVGKVYSGVPALSL